MTDDRRRPQGTSAADVKVCRADDAAPGAAALRAAVSRLRRELAGHPAELRDRGIAEEELAALADAVDAGVLENGRLRQSLLVVAGAIGSVSALAAALAEVRHAVDRCCTAPVRPYGP